LEGEKKKESLTRGVGFIACYKGKEIASAASLKDLTDRARVKSLLGKKDLVIKHTVPENLIAIY